MMTGTIELSIPAAGLRPFGELLGKLRMGPGDLPDGLELRLFWATRGCGTEEVGVVETLKVDPTGQVELPFRFELPRKPYSFSGTLVSVVWAVELVDSKGQGLALEEFTLSPTGEELVLGRIDKPRSDGKKRRWAPQTR